MPDTSPVVAIASEDGVFRGALAAALSKAFLNQVLSVDEPEDLKSALGEFEPTVLILDRGDSRGSEAARTPSSSIPTLILGPDDPASMIEAVESGALGYVTRNARFSEIVQATLDVSEGTAVIPPFMLGALLHHVVQQRRAEASARTRLDTLTPRELEVFELAAIGLSHDDVADRLYISAATARTHLHRIFKKLDIHSKAELVGLAASCGLPTVEGM